MSAETPAVSVIIATYNSCETLHYALQSVLAQDLADFEAWVIGDGCTDGSEEAVAKFRDSRLRWINLPQNCGHQWLPNNTGLRRARGRYFAFLGHDDLWLPWHLSALVGHAEKSGADFVHDLLVNVGSEGVLDVNGPPPEGMTYEQYGFPPSSWLHRRDVVEKIGYWRNPAELSWHSDYDFTRRVYLAGLRIEFVPSLGVVKFPAAHWRHYSATGARPQATAWQSMREDPARFSSGFLIDTAISFSRFTRQGARQPLKQALRQAAAAVLQLEKVFVRAVLDIYGRDRWPVRTLLLARMRRHMKTNRQGRGLPRDV